MTTTLAAIRDQILRETGLGKVGTATGGSTTSLVAANADFQRPTTGAEWPPGSVIRVTGGTAVGAQANVSQYTPSTGTFSLYNTITAPVSGDTFVITKNMDTIDRVDEAINRAIQNRIKRWQKVILTYVADGDMMASDTSSWATTNVGVTISKTTPPFPETIAGQVLKMVQPVASATAGVRTTGVTTVLNTSATWFFAIPVACPNGGTLTVTAIDLTSDTTFGTAITGSYITGSQGSSPNVVTSADFTIVSGTCVLPSTCSSVGLRAYGTQLTGGAGLNYYLVGPAVLYPVAATVFPFAPRVLRTRIGNFHYGNVGSSPSATSGTWFSTEIMRHGRTATINDLGGQLSVSFADGEMPYGAFDRSAVAYASTGTSRVLYYDELVYGATLTSDTDTTTFAKDWVVKAATYELYKRLDWEAPNKTDNYGRPIPSQWAPLLRDAGLHLQNANAAYGPGKITLQGRSDGEQG